MTDAPQVALSRVVARPLERIGGALEAALGRERGWEVRSVDRAQGTLVVTRQRQLGRSWSLTVRLEGAGSGRTRVAVESRADEAVVDELMRLLEAEIAGD